ncbi:MAG: hypothetical protein K5869_07955 [Saccharofermentans sp.]|nr:hypothetical protein [Saccharofermentans sp.]
MNKTYNKISAVLLAAGMMVIPSCSKKGPGPATVTSSVAAATAQTPVETSAGESTSGTSALAPVFAYEGQLDAITAAKGTWYVEGDSDMKYAVTDLDMNGRYEITAAKKDHFAMYEVKADSSGIDKVEAPFEDGTQGPYIEAEYKLRMSKEGSYVYVARETDDTTSAVTTYYYLVSLSNGKIKADVIATEIKEDGNVRYGDDEYDITKEEFLQKTDTGLPSVEYVQKVAWGDAAAVSEMNDGKALQAICFKLTK